MHNPFKTSSGALTVAPRIPAATYLLSLGQAMNLVAAVVSVTVAALVGAQLAPTSELATIPYGLQFAAIMLFTYPAAVFMKHHGRKFGFLVGTMPLIASGIVGYLAVLNANFALLGLAHFLLGAYAAFANFYRFAAVDRLPAELKPRALSIVISGGVLAAVVGPWLAVGLRDVAGFPQFALCYAAFVVLGGLTIVLLAFWKAPATPSEAISIAVRTRVANAGLSFPIMVAIFSAAGGYLIMNFLMIQASLVMKEMHVHFNTSSQAIQIHVLAMFVPSFFTGHLIAKAGLKNILMAGFLLLGACAILGITAHGHLSMLVGLVLLGLGWNFTYVGGGALLAQHLEEENRHRWQGINDVVIAVCATVGAFSPSVLLSALGWQGSNLVCLFICLAGLAISYSLKNRATV